MKKYELSYVQTDEKELYADFLVAIDPTGEENAKVFFSTGLKIGFLIYENGKATELYDVAKISDTFHKIKCIDDCWKEQDGCVTLEDVLKNYNEAKGVVVCETVEMDEDYNFHDYVLKQDEITCIGNERFCSVQTMYNNNCGMDDEYNGSREECIEYCRKEGLVLGIDAQIAYVECENGIVDFCDRVDFEIPKEVFDAYDKNEWDDEDVKKYAELNDNDLDNMDGYEFLEYVCKEHSKNKQPCEQER